jgi:hypothetical protein
MDGSLAIDPRMRSGFVDLHSDFTALHSAFTAPPPAQRSRGTRGRR